ncbi:MAG: SAM-dependent methyltransferase [Rhodospirillales bacterium]|nr:SAM-dependent methyltransferase [Rhodospirillales bacterium]
MENISAEIADEIVRLREQLFLEPRDTRAMRDLAVLLGAAGDLPGAIDLYQRALRVDPYDAEVLVRLGKLWNWLGDFNRARSWFVRALSVDPDCGDATDGLAELADAGTLTPAYIRTLFDQYADRFDENLTGTLAYRAPQEVAAILARCGIAKGAADILDLGCGTGLSGLALHSFAGRLVGVDLSPMMVAKAALRRIYDDLAVAEAQSYLDQATQDWDVIAAVDMLNYVGDLTPTFKSAATRIRRSGWLVGTVEKRAEGGMALTEKRRYEHGEDHLRQSIKTAGLTVVEISEAVLRQEGGQPVAGLIFAARR